MITAQLKNKVAAIALSRNELLDIVAHAFRFGQMDLVEPFLALDFEYRNIWILAYAQSAEESKKWLRESITTDVGSQMLMVKSPYTGSMWLRFSKNPRSSFIGMIEEKGKIRFMLLCDRICDGK